MTSVTLRPVDGVHITTLIDNSSDLLLPDEGLVRRWGLAGSVGALPVVPTSVAVGGRTVDVLRAEHGFSALVEVFDGTTIRRVLYDAGATPDGLAANIDRLALDPSTFEAIVFSHGHFDHVMGLHGLVRKLGASGLPIYLHPDAWLRRRLVGPESSFDLPTPSRKAIEGAGFTVIEGRRPSFLLNDTVLITGEVQRVTGFETGMPTQQAWCEGRWRPDPLVHDDQAAVVHVRDKGLVVLTGCGHAGVVNIVRHARQVTGIERLYAVLGGFHLRVEPVISASVEALAGFAPAVVVPAHCTSWRAQQALASRLPDAFLPNSVGSRFEL